MGQVNKTRSIILIICFLLTGLLLTMKPESKTSVKSQPLEIALGEINNWKISGISPLSPEIYDALALDDYVFQNYSDAKNTVSLYIGYYFSGKKVGSAHDPLVCFPGQGWKLSDKSTGALRIESNSDPIVNYSTILATRGMEKTFLLYWFQSYDTTNPDTFSQKISLLKSKLLGNGEDNAFVRLSVPLGERSQEECKQIISKFIQDFYPVYLNYVRNN